MRATDLADLVVWLPAGTALWVSMGGPSAVPREVQRLQAVEYLLRALVYQNSGSKGKKPEPPKPPEYAHEREAREDAQDRKAAAYLRRQSRMAKD